MEVVIYFGVILLALYKGVLFPAKDISVKVSEWVSKLIGSITFRKSGRFSCSIFEPAVFFF